MMENLSQQLSTLNKLFRDLLQKRLLYLPYVRLEILQDLYEDSARRVYMNFTRFLI